MRVPSIKAVAVGWRRAPPAVRPGTDGCCAHALAQRQFLADASHELRAPLTVLSSEVELALRRERTPEEYERTLHAVAADIARLVLLADQLLDLERATAEQAPTPARAELRPVLERAARRDRQLQVTHALTGSVPVSTLELEQMLDNLVDNGRLHGSGAVTLSATLREGFLVLTVHDEGHGPSADFVPVAVERFRREDLARATPGNGLGLALVHQLLRNHGGELRLCSRGAHHRYPPYVTEIGCDHDASGTTASLLLPGFMPGS